jgi:hypothetical protein
MQDSIPTNTSIINNQINGSQDIFFMRGVILVIAALAPLLFLVAQNQYMYTIPQIFASLAFVTVFCAVLYWVFILAATVLRRDKKKSVRTVTFFNIKVEIALFAASMIAFFVLCLVFGVLWWQERIHQTITSLWNACFVSIILFTIGSGYSSIRSRILGVILYVFVSISIMQLLYGEIRDVLPGSNSASHGDTQQIVEKAQFKVKPNIYLFLLESFHSREILNNVYGIDTKKFADDLTEEGYTFYDPVYANYYPTLPSSGSLFRMEHTYFRDSQGNMDVNKETSQILSGIFKNPVLDTLKKNGYSIAYILSDNYLYRFHNKNIDYTNLKSSFVGFFQPVFDVDSVMHLLIRPIVRLNKKFRDMIYQIVYPQLEKVPVKPQTVVVNDDERLNELMYHIKMSKSDRPTFRFIYWIGAEHIDLQIGRIIDRNVKLQYVPSWISEYKVKEQKAEAEIMSMVRRISQDDPSALVILLGDHGALLKYSMVLDEITTGVSLDELRKTASDYGFTLADLAKDVSSAFLAVKWPNEINVPEKQAISHVNLFRLIFSALSGDETLMRDKVPNTSHFLLGERIYTTIKEGVVMDEWEMQQ